MLGSAAQPTWVWQHVRFREYHIHTLIDGHFDPPLVFPSVELMDEAAAIWGSITGIEREDLQAPATSAIANAQPPTVTANSPLERAYRLDQAMARISPTPVPVTQQGASVNLDGSSSSAEGTDDQETGEEGAPNMRLFAAIDMSLHRASSDGYAIRATVLYPPPFVPGAKPTKKMQPIIKVFTIDLKNATRYKLIQAILKVHGLAQAFQPGSVSGPSFKIYWSGSR